MLKQLLLFLSRAVWARFLLTHFPPARRVARRFVAGETLAEALAVAKKLNGQNMHVTLDFLGESVHRAEDTQAVVRAYLALIEAVHAQKLDAGVSLKLTHLGLDIAPQLATENLCLILEAAQDIPVTIDMESSEYTQTTLDLFYKLRFEDNRTNLRTVIQSYLYRSEADMINLGEKGASIRLCKGAYLESSDIAFPAKSDVDANYIKLSKQYLQSGGFLAMATHDEAMIDAAKAFIRAHDIPAERYEFQMLYGIRSQLQNDLMAEGFPLRIYVPFGEAWYPYFMRRLAERPANLWFFMRSFFRG